MREEFEAMGKEMSTPVSERPKREVPKMPIVTLGPDGLPLLDGNQPTQIIDPAVEAWAKSMAAKAKPV